MAMLPLLVAGVVIAFIMVQHHEIELYAGAERAVDLPGCTEGGAFDCGKVNTSPWSDLDLTDDFKIPVALLAIPTYVVMGLLALVGLLRGERRALGYAFTIGAATVVHSLALFLYSKLSLDTLCTWCLSLYVLNLVNTVLAYLALRGPPHRLVLGTLKDLLVWPRTMTLAGGVFALVLVLSVIGHRRYHASVIGAAASAITKLDAAETTDSAPTDDRDPAGELTERSWEVQREGGGSGTLRIGPGDVWYGNADAKVVIVEFADLECGFCKRLAGELTRIKKAYADDVLLVFKHFVMHPDCNPGVRNKKHHRGCAAAAAAECAAAQGRFWAWLDLAFKNNHKLDPRSLEAYAEHVGLDVTAFKQCVGRSETKQAVHDDGKQGMDVGVRGTPRLYINGVLYKGPRVAEAIAVEIDKELGRPAEAASHTVLAGSLPPIQPVPAGVPAMRDMHYGDLRFSIDTFEASIEGGKAVSGFDRVPATGVTWHEARAACLAAGKRLCSEQEWLAACQGALPVDDDRDGSYADDMIEGTAFPYGDAHDETRCWDGKDRDGQRPVYTGSMPGCVSPGGVYDLVGNVEEWVGPTETKAVLMGGGYDTGASSQANDARCYRPNTTFGPGYGAYRNGFRCCKDP